MKGGFIFMGIKRRTLLYQNELSAVTRLMTAGMTTATEIASTLGMTVSDTEYCMMLVAYFEPDAIRLMKN
jgi:hypothetical protein